MEESKQRFCRHCSSKIPFDSRFCPHCGMRQEQETAPPATDTKGILDAIRPSIVKNQRRLRIVMLSVNLMIFVAFFYIGSQTPLTQDVASQIMEEFREVITPDPSPLSIIINNITLCLFLFLPIVGTFFLAFISYNSGIVLAAIAQVAELNSIEIFVSSLLFPFSWLEILAYSLASSQGIMLLLSFLTQSWRKEIKNSLILLAICLLLLGIGGLIEATYIN